MSLEPFDLRLDPTSRATLAVGFSGGGDSLALLLHALDWARAHSRPVLALTVDHGLNPDSGAWTQAAGAQARRLGAGWQALSWAGPKPTTGVQAKARAARHALLAEAARAAGARVVLMGHTADDIAEGDRMRATDTPGLGRLRDWSPSPVWPEGRGVFLLRPLLGASRADLRAYLVARGETWFDDPANTDPSSARVRARQALAGAPSPPAPPPLDLTGWASRARFDVDGALLPLPAPDPGLAAALLSVSGRSQPPRAAELHRMAATITAGGVATLSGCRVSVKDGQVRIVRAPPRRGEAPRPIEPVDWVRARFAAACGLVGTEASIPPP